MLGAIRAISETVKDWRDHRDVLYRLVATVSAALVVSAMADGQKPSNAVATLAHGLGMTSVADWFGAKSPPLLASSSPAVNSIALSAVLLLLAGMVGLPLWRSRDAGDHMVAYESLQLLGSPAASTVWVLVMAAAQHGDVTVRLRGWLSTALSVGAWSMSGLLIAGGLYLIAARRGYGELAMVPLQRAAFWLFRIYLGVVAALCAIALAPIVLPLSVLGWMSAVESDHTRERHREAASARVRRRPRPTGAAVPLRAAGGT